LRDEFPQKGVEGVILDLRRNGGGLLAEGAAVAGMLVDGPIMLVRDATGKIGWYQDPTPGLVWSGPLLLLVDRQTASAAEIVARVVKDYGRGPIVGDKTTYGKGTIQTPISLDDPGTTPTYGFGKLTRAMFYGPGFRSEDKQSQAETPQWAGVDADIVIPSPTDIPGSGESGLENPLPFDRIPAIEHPQYGLCDAELVNKLRNGSASRQGSTELAALASRRDILAAREQRKRMIFNLTSLEDESRELPSEDKNSAKDLPFGADAYTSEVLDIALDQLRFGKGSVAASTTAEPTRAQVLGVDTLQFAQ
jgi:carboxyl-terminal processing protease